MKSSICVFHVFNFSDAWCLFRWTWQRTRSANFSRSFIFVCAPFIKLMFLKPSRITNTFSQFCFDRRILHNWDCFVKPVQVDCWISRNIRRASGSWFRKICTLIDRCSVWIYLDFLFSINAGLLPGLELAFTVQADWGRPAILEAKTPPKSFAFDVSCFPWDRRHWRRSSWLSRMVSVRLFLSVLGFTENKLTQDGASKSWEALVGASWLCLSGDSLRSNTPSTDCNLYDRAFYSSAHPQRESISALMNSWMSKGLWILEDWLVIISTSCSLSS